MNSKWVIYMDHASTTALDQKVLETMLPYFHEKYGNPESLHQKGYEAKIDIDTAREKLATHLNCKSSEIIFTGSGTQANNLAIFGVARANKQRGNHIITTKIEHSSILESCKKLQKEGFEITYLEPDQDGLIAADQVKQAITDQTTLVSIIHANNEIGVLQPIEEIAKVCQQKKVLFHTDACQSTGSLSIDTQKLKVDLLTLNGSKIYGPKGIGALFVKNGTAIEALIFGGEQEFGLQAGTSNSAAIIGLAKAMDLMKATKDEENLRLTTLRDKLIDNLLQIPGSRLNGHRTQRLPNNINISFKDTISREIIMQLDNSGICASSASACHQNSDERSHVLLAINLPENFGTVRLSLGKETSEEDIDYTIKTLTSLIPLLRQNRRH